MLILLHHHVVLIFLLSVGCQLAPTLADNQEWKNACKFDDGEMLIRADIKKTFTPFDSRVPTIVVDSESIDVVVKCTNEDGRAKLYDDEDDILKEGKEYVEYNVWPKNYNGFWKSEKTFKCNQNGCAIKVLESKDGSHFKSNCSLINDEAPKYDCQINDWWNSATSTKHGNEMECNEVDEYDHEAYFKLSFFNQETKNWTACNSTKRRTNQEKEFSHFMQCDLSGVASWNNESLIVRMQKVHESKINVGLPWLNGKPDCQESAYFIIGEDESQTEELNSKPFLNKATIAIFVVLSLIIVIMLVCILKLYKSKKKTYQPGKLFGRENPLEESSNAEIGLIGSDSPSGNNSGKNSTARLSSIEDIDECLFNENKNTSNFDRQCSIKLEALQKVNLNESTEGEKKEKISTTLLDGDSAKINPNLPMSQQTRILHYDRRFERCKSSFNIGHIIGEGQFGSVFVGTAKNIYGPEATKVAVKQVKDMLDENQINVIIDELKILSNLKMHLNLVNLVGACTSELLSNEVYLLLEYCPFGDMKKFLVERRDKFMASLQNRPGHFESPFNSKLLYSWSYSIAQGMEYLASKKIMHGDLAARNILVGENYVAKISDFGLSKMMYYNQDYKKTQRRLIPWAWMATEYLQTGEFNIKSDVWSYGVTLWEIFSLGNKPYGFDPYEETKVKILTGHRLPCPDPLEYIDGGTSVYDDVMMKCWEAEAAHRPDFTKISSMLEALLGESGVDEYNTLVNQYEKKQALLHTDQAAHEELKLDQNNEPGQGYIRFESSSSGKPDLGSYVEVGALKKDNVVPENSSHVGYSQHTLQGGYIGLQEIKHT